MNNRFKKIIIVIAVLLIAVTLFVAPVRTAVVRIGGNIVSPVTGLFHNIGSGISDWFYSITHANGLVEENNKLTEKVKSLENKISTYSGLKKENERLQKLLDIQESYKDIPSEGAEIIARSDGNWFVTFTINKGKKDGIRLNQPVLYGDGLVGHTVEVGSSWAKVVTLLDTTHAVSGMVVRSGDYVLVEGELTLKGNGQCKMTNITENADVVVGDVIVSSGMGGVYPKDIVIGTVKSFKKGENGEANYAVIQPSADFERLHEVLVLKTEE